VGASRRRSIDYQLAAGSDRAGLLNLNQEFQSPSYLAAGQFVRELGRLSLCFWVLRPFISTFLSFRPFISTFLSFRPFISTFLSFSGGFGFYSSLFHFLSHFLVLEFEIHAHQKLFFPPSPSPFPSKPPCATT